MAGGDGWRRGRATGRPARPGRRYGIWVKLPGFSSKKKMVTACFLMPRAGWETVPPIRGLRAAKGDL